MLHSRVRIVCFLAVAFSCRKMEAKKSHHELHTFAEVFSEN